MQNCCKVRQGIRNKWKIKLNTKAVSRNFLDFWKAVLIKLIETKQFNGSLIPFLVKMWKKLATYIMELFLNLIIEVNKKEMEKMKTEACFVSNFSYV